MFVTQLDWERSVNIWLKKLGAAAAALLAALHGSFVRSRFVSLVGKFADINRQNDAGLIRNIFVCVVNV